MPAADEEPRHDSGEAAKSAVWKATLRPGLGLLLVNVGYVAVIAFGAATAHAHRLDSLRTAVVPLFAAGVIASRTLLGTMPDRLGSARVLIVAAAAEASGLAVFASASSAVVAASALIALAVGQGLAVPSLGALALADVPAMRRGAAAGAFFAYFDAGVGLGGPLTGAVTRSSSPPAAIVTAAVAVALAIPVALAAPRRRPSRQANVDKRQQRTGTRR